MLWALVMKKYNPFRHRTLILGIAALFYMLSPVHAIVIGQLGILDDSANGGINPATGVSWGAGDTYRLVFVSSTFRDPTSSNIADYNLHVQQAAIAVGLGTVNWYAIASTATVDARDNTLTNTGVHGPGVGLFKMDGTTKIADNYTDLWDGSIDSPINLTESNGAYSPPGSSPFGNFGGVWAGTADNGTRFGNNVLGAPGTGNDLGLAGSTNSQWIRRSSRPNSETGPLGFYAISDVLTVTIVPEPSSMTLLLLGFSSFIFRRRRCS